MGTQVQGPGDILGRVGVAGHRPVDHQVAVEEQ